MKSRMHHEGTKDTKVFVGCASRTGLERRSEFNMIFSSFVLFVSFVVIYSVSNADLA
jgi:hypothetical protein